MSVSLIRLIFPQFDLVLLNGADLCVCLVLHKLILITATTSIYQLKFYAVCSIRQHLSVSSALMCHFPLGPEACRGFGTSDSIKKV